MIKFFRKIRFDLMEKNKTGKYLKYAIGEIILVVIGILIALSINNWNEGRKNKILVENYTQNLIEDLTKDSISVSRLIVNIKNDSTFLNNFEKRISKSTAALDTILKIARYEYNFYIWIHEDYNNDTFKVLTSTGNIGLFKSEITNDLNTLHNLQEEALNAQNQTFETYRNGLIRYAQKYPIPFQSNLIANGTPAADIIWKQISLREHSTEFNALVIAKGDSYRLSLRSLPMVLVRTNELLTKLRD